MEEVGNRWEKWGIDGRSEDRREELTDRLRREVWGQTGGVG